MAVHRLAHELGKHAWEIEALSPREFSDWIAYFAIKAQMEKDHLAKAKAQSKADGRRINPRRR